MSNGERQWKTLTPRGGTATDHQTVSYDYQVALAPPPGEIVQQALLQNEVHPITCVALSDHQPTQVRSAEPAADRVFPLFNALWLVTAQCGRQNQCLPHIGVVHVGQ